MNQATHKASATPYPFLASALVKLEVIAKDKPDLEVKRIQALKQLHLVGKKSGWLIGELLIQQDHILRQRYEDWKNTKRPEGYNQPKTVYQWVPVHTEEIGFGVKMAQRYIRLRQFTDQDSGDKLGVKKVELIRMAPKKSQDKLKEKAIEEGWSTAKVEQAVNRERDKQIKARVFKKEIRPNLPKVHVMLDRKVKNRIIIKVAEENRDLFNDILQEKYLLKIQEDMFFVLNKDVN